MHWSALAFVCTRMECSKNHSKHTNKHTQEGRMSWMKCGLCICQRWYSSIIKNRLKWNQITKPSKYNIGKSDMYHTAVLYFHKTAFVRVISSFCTCLSKTIFFADKYTTWFYLTPFAGGKPNLYEIMSILSLPNHLKEILNVYLHSSIRIIRYVFQGN